MLSAIRLRTEYLTNPLGIDILHPQLGWNLTGDGKFQTAYEIRAAHCPEDLQTDRVIWREKRQSRAMKGIEYKPELQSRELVYWQVRIWDENDQAGAWSEPASFEMGLLSQEDWEAEWITGDYDPEPAKRYPADEFQKFFTVGSVRKARLYITACGVYEAYLNGNRVGNQILTPGLTSYEKRTHYQVYDVTDLLKSGENKWNISLGDGWFRGKMGVFGATNVYGNVTCVKARLEITDEAGNMSGIVTDGRFSWSNDGAIRFNDMKDGETIEGGRVPSYSGKAKVTEWNTILCSANNVPVTEHEVFEPKRILKTPDGSTVLDFGQNIAGYVRFSIEGEAGHTAILHMGEMLDEAGNFSVKNVVIEDTTPAHIPDYCDDSRFQTIRYICSGNGREVWKPRFCVQGFQYVKLENWPEEVRPEHFQAIAVYSDLEITADFHCSSENIEKLAANTLWSMKGNFLDVPTDCPTRERAPWLGDAQLFFDTGCYFMDFTAFFRKWIRDIFDDQAEDGKVYNIVPRGAVHGGMNEYVEGSSGWTDAGILLPYRYWKHFGDTRILKDYYPQMKRLIEFMLTRMGDESDPDLDSKLAPGEYRAYVVTSGFHFGEWNEPGSNPMDVIKPKYEEATAYLSYSLHCFAEMAQALGYTEDAGKYGDLSDKVKAAYQHYFTKNGMIQSDRMCQYVRPLALHLLPDQAKDAVSGALAKMVRENGYHVGTGFLSTPFVLNELSKAGYAEEAYRMLENEEYPSWIYEISQGATTVWENWNGEASRNHYSNGACCDWIFNGICGINMNGENSFIISPKAGGSLEFASLNYRSIYGEIGCAWKKTEDGIEYTIQVPAGCQAEWICEGQEKRILTAGIHQIKA